MKRSADILEKSRLNAATGRLKVVSWNLLHRSGAVVEDICELIDQENPDLFLMQEATEAIERLPDIVGGRFYKQPWPGRSHGLAAWSPEHPARAGVLKLPASKMPGRLPPRFAQILQIKGMTIANVHLSHGQILNRLQLRRIARSTAGPTAIIGDYNTLGPIVLHHFSDVGPRGHTHRAQQVVPFRLDRCMVRQLQCVGARRLRRGSSDHRPIALELV
ncbi:MAG TPA: endonuclease/exonuclease/phosphatase family protein [Afifellaceae bacterium]|nr:endonuclease/exonuclease/phosphatase family protein [Afifellaceae bacterium]